MSAEPEDWVDQYGTSLFRYAMGHVRDQNVAEDLVQETFLAALRARENFRGRSSFLTWLTSILRRKVIDYQRALGRQAKTLAATNQEDDICVRLFDGRRRWRKTLGSWPESPSEDVERSEFWQILEACIERLPRPLGEAFRLREIMAREIDDICEIVGISNGNLAVRLHRARLALRTCLEDRWFT